MSIRLLAQEIYTLHRQVEALENKLKIAPPDKKDLLNDELRKLKAEKNRMRQALDGTIDRKSTPKKRFHG